MRPDAYQVVTDRIIKLLEHGRVPWQKPWKGPDMAPRNLITKREYRGVNVFMLRASMFRSPFFVTFKQANELGGYVRRGETAFPVVFWKWLEVEDKAEPTGKKRVPFLRHYGVFNVAQCEAIQPGKVPALPSPDRPHNPIREAERIVADMPKPPSLSHGGNQATYSPALDCVDIPEPGNFRSDQDYYSVMFHELTHSTGHEKRLNRKGVSGTSGEWSAFGTAPYSPP